MYTSISHIKQKLTAEEVRKAHAEPRAEKAVTARDHLRLPAHGRFGHNEFRRALDLVAHDDGHDHLRMKS